MVKEIFFLDVFSTVELLSGHGFQLFSLNYCTVMFWTSIVWCLPSLLFISGYFLKWLWFIHLYLHNSGWISLLRMCTLKFCFYNIIWEGVLQACSHQVEEALFGIVLLLASARFIWWPKFLYWKRESASFSLSLSPLDNLWCPTLPLSPSCSPYPTYFSFNLGWRDPTYSVTACRNCCT